MFTTSPLALAACKNSPAHYFFVQADREHLDNVSVLPCSLQKDKTDLEKYNRNYISLGLGFFLGTQVCAPINDRIYRRLKRRNNNVGRPEFRIPLMIPGSLLVPVGLFIYGWTSQASYLFVPIIPLFVMSRGVGDLSRLLRHVF